VLQFADVREIEARLLGKLPLAEAGRPSLFPQYRAEVAHDAFHLIDKGVDILLNVELFVNSTPEFFCRLAATTRPAAICISAACPVFPGRIDGAVSPSPCRPGQRRSCGQP